MRYNAKRKDYDAFVISISVLLVLALLSIRLRFLIRFCVQRQRFAIDDGLLLVAVALLLSIIIMYREVIDQMYHMWSIICLTTTWCSFSAVKPSFLFFFFRKLIDRIPHWQIYCYADLLPRQFEPSPNSLLKQQSM
ncbi:hypothetical protein BDV29DRAFT_187600 [Aspergillus leporis]|uniref:Uncharacterized protein n=1 Tax=Aspergillus leporis TaxID=41062 RepID=A0A5N5XDT5_9EURO|nr:hypothetical protein BDV29DRAFT_187600 [Aspergillus leporis]